MLFVAKKRYFCSISFMSVVIISGVEDGVGMGVATHYIAHLDLPIRFVVCICYYSLDSFLSWSGECVEYKATVGEEDSWQRGFVWCGLKCSVSIKNSISSTRSWLIFRTLRTMKTRCRKYLKKRWSIKWLFSHVFTRDIITQTSFDTFSSSTILSHLVKSRRFRRASIGSVFGNVWRVIFNLLPI